MKKIATFAGRPLKWSQPSGFKKEFELRGGDELVATLRFRSSFGSFATAECDGECWTFKRTGFFFTQVNIRTCADENVNVAVFNNKTWKAGGTLEFPDGRSFRATSNFWQSRLAFITQSEEPLVEFATGGMIHLSAEVEIRPQAALMPELPLMALLGWYLAIKMKDDASGAAAAAAASA